MTGEQIHFGTSGWRGIIAKDFTFGGVRRASAAIAGHVLAKNKNPTLAVAYDTRFFSPEFADASAEVLRAEGCRVLLCQEATPAPALAHAVISEKLDGGINITASHDPAQYNGLKFSGPDGGPALAEITKDIEKRAAAAKDKPAPHSESSADFPEIHPRAAYFEQLHRMIRFDELKKAKGAFVCDALHGCGAGWLDRILKDNGIKVLEIRAERDVLFGGTSPDSSEDNLAPLKKAVTETKALAGLATDGDADRFGIVDRDGSFVSPNHILGLLFDYLLETRGYKLGASRSVATTRLIDGVARLHGVKVHETPVGFNYVGALPRENKIAMGAEESAGLTIRGHLPEKDGILACLLVGEMIAARGTTIARQLRDLFRRVGREYWPVRINVHLDADVQVKLLARLEDDFKEFIGRKVARTDRTDGLQLTFDDDDWVLVRPSGTEPLVRIYAEAATLAAAQKMAEDARAWVHGGLPGK